MNSKAEFARALKSELLLREKEYDVEFMKLSIKEEMQKIILLF